MEQSEELTSDVFLAACLPELTLTQAEWKNSSSDEKPFIAKLKQFKSKIGRAELDPTESSQRFKDYLVEKVPLSSEILLESLEWQVCYLFFQLLHKIADQLFVSELMSVSEINKLYELVINQPSFKKLPTEACVAFFYDVGKTFIGHDYFIAIKYFRSSLGLIDTIKSQESAYSNMWSEILTRLDYCERMQHLVILANPNQYNNATLDYCKAQLKEIVQLARYLDKQKIDLNPLLNHYEKLLQERLSDEWSREERSFLAYDYCGEYIVKLIILREIKRADSFAHSLSRIAEEKQVTEKNDEITKLQVKIGGYQGDPLQRKPLPNFPPLPSVVYREFYKRFFAAKQQALKKISDDKWREQISGVIESIVKKLAEEIVLQPCEIVFGTKFISASPHFEYDLYIAILVQNEEDSDALIYFIKYLEMIVALSMYDGLQNFKDYYVLCKTPNQLAKWVVNNTSSGCLLEQAVHFAVTGEDKRLFEKYEHYLIRERQIVRAHLNRRITESKFPLHPNNLARYTATHLFPFIDALSICVISFRQFLTSLVLFGWIEEPDLSVHGAYNLLWIPFLLGSSGVLFEGILRNREYFQNHPVKFRNILRVLVKYIKNYPLAMLMGFFAALTKGVIFFGSASTSLHLYGVQFYDSAWLDITIVISALVFFRSFVVDVNVLAEWFEKDYLLLKGNLFNSFNEMFDESRFDRWWAKFVTLSVPLSNAVSSTALGVSQAYIVSQALCNLILSAKVSNRTAWFFAIPLGIVYGFYAYGLTYGSWQTWTAERYYWNHRRSNVTFKQRCSKPIKRIAVKSIANFFNPLMFFVMFLGGLTVALFIAIHSFPPLSSAENDKVGYQLPIGAMVLFLLLSIPSALLAYCRYGRSLIIQATYTHLQKQEYNDCIKNIEKRNFQINQGIIYDSYVSGDQTYHNGKRFFDYAGILIVEFLFSFGIRWGMTDDNHYLTASNQIWSTLILTLISGFSVSIYLLLRNIIEPILKVQKTKTLLLGFVSGSMFGAIPLLISTLWEEILKSVPDEEMSDKFTASEMVGAICFAFTVLGACIASVKIFSEKNRCSWFRSREAEDSNYGSVLRDSCLPCCRKDKNAEVTRALANNC